MNSKCQMVKMMFKLIFIFTLMFFSSTILIYAQSSVSPEYASPLAKNFKLVIDSDDSDAPTPINNTYFKAINSTQEGDQIFSYQKYFRNSRINNALISAAARKVKVRGIYRDQLEPPCNSWQLSKKILCEDIFVNSPLPHHKNMMILYKDGTVHAIVGSYNLRERTFTEPRAHTVLAFDIINGRGVFDYYCGEADRLNSLSTIQPKKIVIDIDGGGTIKFQMHPSDAHPVLDMLNAITTFESTLWVSFYSAGDDRVSKPVYDRLKELKDAGCDVRVLLYSKNSDALRELEQRGVPVKYPIYPVGSAMLGHKLVMIRSGGDLHLIQSSANLTESNYYNQNNLTLYLQAPGLITIQSDLENELNRYWR
jgi:hypothetical protein